MQNQQVISRIYELENELKKIKALIQKKPVKKTGLVWGKINFLDSQIEEAKTAVFDFDIERFVDKKDVASWK